MTGTSTNETLTDRLPEIDAAWLRARLHHVETENRILWVWLTVFGLGWLAAVVGLVGMVVAK
jgi:type IV secretory pathway component VirB8